MMVTPLKILYGYPTDDDCLGLDRVQVVRRMDGCPGILYGFQFVRGVD